MDERKIPRLIEEVHTRPIIWDKTSNQYENKIKKGQEWSKVADILNVSKTSAQTKWRSRVKTFKSEYSRVQSRKSGDRLDDAYESTWSYYESLTFVTNSVIPNSSSGNLDLDDNPSLLGTSLTESKVIVTTDSLVSAASATVTVPISRKSEITEKLLQMATEKADLIEKSFTRSKEVDDTAESDNLNLSFFITLLPELRLVDKDKMLLCRSDISRVVYNYAYEGSTWESSNDKKENCEVPVKKMFSSPLKKTLLFEDDDDCQIVEVSKPPQFHYQPKFSIKKEAQYEPRWEKFHSERPRVFRRSNEMAISYDEYNGDIRSHNPRWKYNYDEQSPPEYPGHRNFVASSARQDRFGQFLTRNLHPPQTNTPQVGNSTYHHSYCVNMNEVSVSRNIQPPPRFQSAASGQPASIGRATIPGDRPSVQLPIDAHNSSQEENRLTEHEHSGNVTVSSTDTKLTNQFENEI